MTRRGFQPPLVVVKQDEGGLIAFHSLFRANTSGMFSGKTPHWGGMLVGGKLLSLHYRPQLPN